MPSENEPEERDGINSIAELLDWMRDEGFEKDERNAIESIIAASVTAERGRCADICSRIADDELVASREPGIGPMLSFERVSRSRIAMKCEEEIRNPTPRDEPGNRIKTDCRSF